MRFLLDTHALIWWSGDQQMLRSSVIEAIAGADEVRVSAVSVYEMSLKYSLGKLPGVAHLLPILSEYLREQRFAMLDLGYEHADRAGRLPLLHRDPFDRMLVAQALVEDLTIVSNEAMFDEFGVRRLW